MSSIISTDLNFGTVSLFYHEVYEACCPNGNAVTKEVYDALLKQGNLTVPQVEKIYELTGPGRGPLTRISVYKSLALIAWAQQGKELTDRLFENFSGAELPIPTLTNLSAIKKMTAATERKLDPNNLSYADLLSIDTISVDLVPEKKGLFLKHSEYVVTSQRFRSAVRRRYNDFFALHELLLAKYPYRMVPRLPPKKVVVTSGEARFLEARRRALARWLCLVARHPVLASDAATHYFLKERDHEELRHRIRQLFGKGPDEFTLAAQNGDVEDTISHELSIDFAANQEQIRHIYLGLTKVKQIFDQVSSRNEADKEDMRELGTALAALGSPNPADHDAWAKAKKGFINAARSLDGAWSRISFPECSGSGLARGEALWCALDALSAHRELCSRLARGVHAERTYAANMSGRAAGDVGVGYHTESAERLEAARTLRARSAFALHCANTETRIARAHLALAARAVLSAARAAADRHQQMAGVWNNVETSLSEFLTKEERTEPNGN